jgi:hypothetical protein
MRILPVEFNAVAMDILPDEFSLRVVLMDGREIAVPFAYFPRLFNATPEQRANWRLIGHGEGISWEELDEDISVRGLLRLH